MVRVYLGVGSNLGDRRSHLERAKQLVRKISETHFLRGSFLRETEPVGGPFQGKFLNGVWEIETRLPARELKDRLLQIEAELGRRRNEPNAPREIDLDILFYGDQMIDEPHLQIPHPRLQERAFVLEPLSELVPELIHPKLKKTMKELLEENQKKSVKK